MYTAPSFLTSAPDGGQFLLLYLPGKRLYYQLDVRLGGPQIWSESCGIERKLLSSAGNRIPDV
jgi:hypothetical protein